MNVLVTGDLTKNEKAMQSLEKLGHTLVKMTSEKDGMPVAYDEVEGVICNGLFLYHDIEKFKNLKYIQLTSAGFDRVPMDYVTKNNIAIHNARGVYSIPMAEIAVCGVLQLYKMSKFFMNNQTLHKWEKHRGLLELSGKTVCILGCGSVGAECAKRFKAFDCRVIGVDVVTREDESFEKIVTLDKIDEVLSTADIIILTLPLTDQTRGMFDSKKLSCMKKGAVFVNIARGAIVDQVALIDALKDHLFGAVLDVFEEEPLGENSPLLDMENVIVTPHNSFVGDGNRERLNSVILKNIERIE